MATLRDFAPGYEQATLRSLVPDYTDGGGPVPTRYGPDMSGYDVQAELDNTSEFGKGYKSTRLGLEASYLAAEESSLRAKGDDAAADLLVPRRVALEERAGLFAPKERSAYDLKDNFSLRRGADFALGAMGGMGASLVDSMATGVGASALARGASTVGTVVAPFTGPAAPFVAGASRLLGAAAPYIGEAAAFVPNYLQAKGATVQAAWKDPELMARTTAQERDDAASLSGVGQAALDTLIPGAMRRRMMGENLYGAAERGLNRLPLAAGVALDSLGEGAQEVVQDRMEKAALSHLNPDRDTSGDWRDTIDNFAAGAVGSAPMAAGSRYMGKGRERLGTEGDGKNGDVIDLNAPDEKPKTILEELNGGVSRFSRRTEAEALVQALEGHTEDPAKIPEAAARQKSVLVEELSKLKGKEAEEHLQKVSGIPVDDPLNAIENLGAPEFLDAAKFVMQKLHITNAELARMKNNAERALIRRTPEDEAFRDRMDEIVRPTRQEQAIDIRAKRAEGDTGVDELRTLKPEAVDPSAFKFELDPSHFLAPADEPTGETASTTINERLAKNKERMERAQQKAKLFNTRAELIANKLWKTAAEWHGADSVNIDAVRDLTQEVMATTTVKDPSPADERRAQRVAEQLVHAVGPQSLEVLQDIWRITGGSKAFRAVADRAAVYANATNSSALKVQHDTRDAAAEEFAKLVPADVETQLLAKGINLSSNKDRNDLLDNMEAFSDGKAIFSRMKINALLTKPVVDAMEEYLGKAIMPRLEGVKDDLIDENDSYGGKTQTGNTEGEHSTEQSLADPRDLTSDEEVSAFDQRQLEKSMDRVAPDSLVFHVSGDKRGSMVKFSDAWKENDDGRLPKLIHPGDGRTLEHVQKLVAKATERLTPEQRDRYVMGNPASKDSMEAAGATNAKKILDDSNVPDDQRLKLMMRYMEQEGKAEVPGEVAHAISNLNVAERARAYISSVLGKRESLSPSGEKLSIDQNAELNQTRGDLDAVLSVAKKSSKYSELAAIPDLGARMAAMVPIVKSAVETARESLARNIPGYQEFAAKNPSADLKDYVNDFFSQRYAVVAEQPTDRDYLQMNLAEFNDMDKKGKANLNSAWVTAGDDEAEQNKVKAGMNIIHFKSRHSNTGEVAIPAYKLVKWVREQENAHTDDKRENDTGSGSPNAQYDSYLDALKQGITALHMGGLTKGLPWIVNAKGEREEFTPADTKGGPTGGTVDDFGTRWAPTKSSTKTFTDDFGDRVTSLGPDKDYNVDREMSYRKAGKTEVENGWVRTGLGDLPPSLDVGGTSYAEYKRSKAHGAMHKRGAASSEEVHNQGLINAKAEEEKNAELSQDEKDVQGEEAVDEAMAIDQGSRTREEERKHLKLMSSVMRAAADHLPKALTVGAAVNKAGKVAEQLWRDYAANREAGLERIFGYVRSMRRPASDDGYEYNKALGELWREFHAADDSQDVDRGPGADRANPGDTLAKSLAARFPDANPEHLSDLLSRGVQTQNDPQGRGAVDAATTDKVGNIQRAIAEKAAEPEEAGHWGVGGTQYAFPLAALLTPRNIANAHPDDQAMFKHLRSAVAAEIMRAALPDPKTPRLPPVLDVGQVRKLVNFLSGYNDQKKAEKLDEAVKPGGRALLERSKLAPVATSFVPNGGMKRFLQGLVDKNRGVLTVPNLGAKFDGEKRGEKDTMTAVRELGAPKKEPRQVETKEPSEVSPRVSPPLLKTPPKAPGAHQPKETAKLLGADRIIAPISPEGYAGDLGRAAQAEGKRFSPKVDTDMTGKVVVVSVPGRGRGFTGVDKIIEHVKMALDRGATVLTDNEANATRAHNAEGEGVLRQALIDGGYTEAYTTDHYSAWQMVGTKEPRQVETKEPSKVATPKADLSMNYADGHGGDHHMRPEFAGRSTMDLIESGDRTATTRSLGGFKGLKKGDVFTATGGGRSVLLRATTDPYRTSEVAPEEWSRLEGWAPSVYAKYNNAWQMRFERVNNGEKHTPSSPIQAPGAAQNASEGVGSQNTLQAAIAKHQEYLKNPPVGYTTERAAAIGAWAAKQLERVRDRAKTDQSDELQDMIDSLRRLVKTVEELTAADQELEAKMGPQAVAADPSKDPEAMNAEKPPELSKAEITTLNKFLTGVGRTKAGRMGLTTRREVLVPGKGGVVRKQLKVIDSVDSMQRTSDPEWNRILDYVVGKDNWHTEWTSIGDIDITTWVLNEDPTSTAEERLDRLELLVRNNLDKLSSEARERVERLWAGEKDLLNPEQRAKATLATKVEERNGLAQRLKDAEYQVSYRRAKYESNRTDRVLERISREALEREETDRGEISKKLAEIDAEIAALEAKLGPQGSVKRNAETIARQTEAESANQFAKLATMAPPKHIEVTSAEKHFERNVSDKVQLILQDVFPGMKGAATFDTTTNIARISTANPLRIMRLTYHEAVHGFFNTILNAKGMETTKELLYRAASEPKMYARLKELLKGEDEALRDMENDMEERVAYMFQFWKLGLLDIDKKPETFFEKVQAMMRRVFGAVRDSEKALAILTAFDQGQLKETSAAGRAIEKIMSQGEWRKKMLAKYDKQAQALYTEVMANHLNFRNSESKTAQLLGRMWYSNPAYGADTEQVKGQDGVINRTKFKRDYYSNRIRVALKPLQGANLKRDLETLAEALNNHTEPTTELLRKAKKDLQAVLTEYRTYAKQAGLDIGEQLGADGKYWPRVYEIEKLINGRESFVNMLLAKHGKLMTTIKAGAIQAGESGIATERDVAEMIHQSLVDRLGVQDNKLKALREDGVLSPFFASMNERTLEWLSDEDVAPYLSKDVIGTMTQYISQGVRAAEYTRTFGEDGRNLRDMLAKKGDVRFISEDGTVIKYEKDGPIRSELATEAENKAVEPSKREEWVERRMEDLKRASGAMEGSLGKDISATARQLQAGAMTYQILRLLPFMIFSSMLDPNGIRVAGGEWEDAFNAYKRGFTGLWNNWKDLFLGNPFGMRDPDEMETAALASGVINSDMENEEMGEVHSSEYSSGLTRHINHVFFKAIGISQWDRDMRIVATDAARKAIVRDYNNAVPEHSARWLRELGLKKSDIFINDQGQLVVSAAELMRMKNIKDAAVAQKLLEPTHFAVNRWVNRAIVSPNAGLRPTRASDPHFAMFYQFKSFTYAFQETTMRYAMHEAEHGNFTAAAKLMHGVPIMIAADMAKAMVTGGGSMPGYMANWTLVDWIIHGINRSGIGGTSTFITDMLGGNVAGTLAGPTVDHIAGVGKDIITGEVGHAVKQSLPVVKQLAGG